MYHVVHAVLHMLQISSYEGCSHTMPQIPRKWVGSLVHFWKTMLSCETVAPKRCLSTLQIQIPDTIPQGVAGEMPRKPCCLQDLAWAQELASSWDKCVCCFNLLQHVLKMNARLPILKTSLLDFFSRTHHDPTISVKKKLGQRLSSSKRKAPNPQRIQKRKDMGYCLIWSDIILQYVFLYFISCCIILYGSLFLK